MPRGLWLLWGLILRAWFRRTLRGLNRPRNLIVFVIGMGAFVMWGGALIAGQFYKSRPPDPGQIRAYGPVAMLGVFALLQLVSLEIVGVYFKPAEIETLFCAPVSRRSLLLYRLSQEWARIPLIGLFAAFIFRRHAAGFVQAWVGATVFLLMANIGQKILSLLGATLGRRLVGRGWVVVAAGMLTVLGFLAWNHSEQSGADLLSRGFWKGFSDRPAVRAVLIPFVAVSETMAAPRVFPGMIGWASLACVFAGLGILAVFWLDFDYREASISTSQRIQERFDRMRRTSPFSSMAASPGSLRRHLPMPPSWRGVGPLFWRQAMNLIRTARSLIFPLLPLAVVVVAVVATQGRKPAASYLLAPLIISPFLVSWLRYDFRSDLEQMEMLRILPVPAWAMALGQILTPTAILTAVHWIVAGLAVAGLPEEAPLILCGAAVSPLLNGVLVSVENLVFLMHPVRMVGASVLDFQHMGRSVVLGLARMAAMGVALGIPFGVGTLAYYAGGRSLLVAAPPAVLSMAVIFGLLVGLVGAAFRRYDVAADTPA